MAGGRLVAYVYASSLEQMREHKAKVEAVLQPSKMGLCDTQNHADIAWWLFKAAIAAGFFGLCWAAGRYWT